MKVIEKIGGALSGGGAHGAQSGGVLHGLHDFHGIEFSILSGTSTGALQQNLVGLADYNKLKTAYTSITNNDIYKINPFKTKGAKNNDLALNFWSFLRMRWFKKQPTFGDSTNLKSQIDKFFSYQEYLETRKLGIELYVCVVNLTKRRKEFYSNMDGEGTEMDYEIYKDWVWASTLAVPFTSIYKHPSTGDYYIDGGFMEHIPIQKLIDSGATKIYAVSTKAEFDENRELNLGNKVEVLIREMISVMMEEISDNDFALANLEAKDKDVEINIIKPPSKISDNSMNFNMELMTKWWQEGYDYVKSGEALDTCEKIELKAGQKMIHKIARKMQNR